MALRLGGFALPLRQPILVTPLAMVDSRPRLRGGAWLVCGLQRLGFSGQLLVAPVFLGMWVGLTRCPSRRRGLQRLATSSVPVVAQRILPPTVGVPLRHCPRRYPLPVV
jgi:hypothetical protein